MKLVGALALLMALAFGMVAVQQVSSLQDISKPITTGSVNDLFGTVTFLTLLIVGVLMVFTIGGIAAYFLSKK
jgi:heme/copper-type cytochrome/quinol oxidase subunit 2